MRRSNIISLLFFAIGLVAPAPSIAVTINVVSVGDPGNANDPATGNKYGGVGYNYKIGLGEVTISQYAAFLNAVAAIDSYGLYNQFMALENTIRGIDQFGFSGAY